jgi:hypothetical protein
LRLFTIARLSDPEYAHAIAVARAEVSDRTAELKAEIAEIEQLMSALSDRLGRREIRLADHDRSYKLLMEDLEPLIAERDSLPGAINGPAEVLSADEVAARWDKSTTLQRRALLTEAIGPDHQFRIMPTRSRGNPVFDTSRIAFVYADEPYVTMSERDQSA